MEWILSPLLHALLFIAIGLAAAWVAFWLVIEFPRLARWLWRYFSSWRLRRSGKLSPNTFRSRAMEKDERP